MVWENTNMNSNFISLLENELVNIDYFILNDDKNLYISYTQYDICWFPGYCIDSLYRMLHCPQQKWYHMAYASFSGQM